MPRFSHPASLAFLAAFLVLPLAAQHPQAGPSARASAARGVAAATALRAARMLRAPRQGGFVFVTPAAVSFNATDPASQADVPASAPVTIHAYIFAPQANTAWNLGVAAAGPDFTSGPSPIPVSAVTYTSTGTITGGTLTTPSGSTPLSATGATVASGVESGGFLLMAHVTCNFIFHDSWNYVPGTYSQSVTFTLATP